MWSAPSVAFDPGELHVAGGDRLPVDRPWYLETSIVDGEFLRVIEGLRSALTCAAAQARANPSTCAANGRSPIDAAATRPALNRGRRRANMRTPGRRSENLRIIGANYPLSGNESLMRGKSR